MTDHDDLVRALLVERFRPWRPDAEPDLSPKQLARAVVGSKRSRQRSTGSQRRPQRPTPTEGGAAT